MTLNTNCIVTSITDKGPDAPKEMTISVQDHAALGAVQVGGSYEVSLVEPAAAPASTPAPTPTPRPLIPVADHPFTLLEVGDYWFEDGVWGAGALTRGIYTGLTGTQYEQLIGVSPDLGPNGEVSGRVSWKWPTGSTEVKSYPSFVNGNKPGYQNSWICPAGENVVLLDGTVRQIYPSGPTPNSIFPLQLPIGTLMSSVDYVHNEEPTGRGHLTYDIWLQKTPTQEHGFNAKGEISHEIMIPQNSWGGYGKYPHRNPTWYSHDAVIDGRLFHIYSNPTFNGGQWHWVCFQPDQDIPPGIELNLGLFIDYLADRGWSTGTEYCVSVECGVEPFDGTGDLNISNYRVWR